MLALLDPGETRAGLFMWSFLKKLPAQLRGALALHNYTTPRQLAVATDSWWEAHVPSALIAATSARPPRSESQWSTRGSWLRPC